MRTADSAAERSALATVLALIKETVGEDHLLGIDSGMDTNLHSGLEIDSIDLVVLTERLTEEYGQRVDFAAWLSGMTTDEITGLTVGDLVDHVLGRSGE